MYKSGFNRDQLALFPTSISDMIDKDSIVFVIDAFVDSLDLVSFNFKYAIPSTKGNRPYDPKDMIKLYLFGYKHKQRSSRTLAYFAKSNIECYWLLKGLTPDFRTIADFRKDNKDNLKKVFYEFNLSLKDLGYLSDINSLDGTKIKAVNSKDKNYTLNKIDDRIKKLNQHISDYFNMLELNDELENKQDYVNDIDNINNLISDIDNIILKDKNIDKDKYISELQSYIDKLNNYKAIEKTIIDNGNTQISLTDPESKLMRNNGKFDVCFNNQVLVDENHFVTDFLVTNNPADLGSITDISSNAKEVYNFDTLTNITDKGYNDRKDMISALENGIIPQVTPLNKDDKTIELETDYIENDITDEMINSTNPDDIKKCLRAGVIPNVYKDNISSIDVVDSYILVDADNNSITDSFSEQDLRDFAINNSCFTRHFSSNKVFCPMGETLRKKSSNKKSIRYCNKLACKNCKNPCTSSSYKTVDFSINQSILIPNKSNSSIKKTKKKRNKVKVKKVVIKLNLNKDLISKRMALSELPHAQLKRARAADYVLLKGIKKVTGECSIYYLSENILHAQNLIGGDKLVNYFKNKKHNLLNLPTFLRFWQNIYIFFFSIVYI